MDQAPIQKEHQALAHIYESSYLAECCLLGDSPHVHRLCDMDCFQQKKKKPPLNLTFTSNERRFPLD